jgi:hypothetical protein
MTGAGRVGRNRGQSSVEVALLAPWIFFLFVGVLDLGFWCYSMISLENGVRAAGLYAAVHPLPNSPSSADLTSLQTQLQVAACAEMFHVINIPAGCANIAVSTPVPVTNAFPTPNHVRFTVTAPMPVMVPIPGLLKASNITRQVEVPVISR